MSGAIASRIDSTNQQLPCCNCEKDDYTEAIASDFYFIDYLLDGSPIDKGLIYSKNGNSSSTLSHWRSQEPSLGRSSI